MEEILDKLPEKVKFRLDKFKRDCKDKKFNSADVMAELFSYLLCLSDSDLITDDDRNALFSHIIK